MIRNQEEVGCERLRTNMLGQEELKPNAKYMELQI